MTDTVPNDRLEITFLTAPDCRHCEHGRAVLAELAARLPLSVREVDLLSEEGRRLVAAGRVAFPPALFVGDRVIAHGRLSLGALERDLAPLVPAPSTKD